LHGVFLKQWLDSHSGGETSPIPAVAPSPRRVGWVADCGPAGNPPPSATSHLGKMASVLVMAAVAAVALVLPAGVSGQFSTDLTLTSPTQGQVFLSTASIAVTWTINNAQGFTHIDLYVLTAELNTIYVSDTNIPAFAQSHTLTVPRSTPSAGYYIVAAPHNDFSILARAPPGQGFMNISRVGCQSHTDGCNNTQYCDADRFCSPCSLCTTVHDAFDRVCPSKCGGSPAFPVGSALPSSDEAASSGELRVPIPLVSTPRAALVTSAIAGVMYSAASASSFPSVMTPRTNTMLQSLHLLLNQDGDFTSVSASILVTQAYLVAPTGIAQSALNYHHEARAVLLELVCPTQSDCTASGLVAAFARMAFAAGFDFVRLESSTVVYASVAPEGCNAPVDLVFLVDSSLSIDDPRNGGAPGTFADRVLPFVTNVSNLFNVGPGQDQSRIGMASFSTTARVDFSLGAHSSNAAVSSAVTSVAYQRGQTSTDLGLQIVRTTMLAPGNGIRDAAANVPRVLMMITDGQANLGHEPFSEAILLHARGDLTIISVGVGQAVNTAELNFMASFPPQDHTFLIKSFRGISQIVNRLTAKVCEATVPVGCDGTVSVNSVVDGDIRYFKVAQHSSNNLRMTFTQSSGAIHVFTSFLDLTPGPASFVTADQSTDTVKTLVISPSFQGGTVYVAVLAVDTSSTTSYIWNVECSNNSFPTAPPTAAPTDTPGPTTPQPTQSPTQAPSRQPTTSPTRQPTRQPTTAGPTQQPTREPTASPTAAPTSSNPTNAPTFRPTTVAPSTVAPTTEAPVTVAPTSIAPTTAAPVATRAPTTFAPTTQSPVTRSPTSDAPVGFSLQPTTDAPVTVAPTTLAPTDASAAPTTAPPVTGQTNSPTGVGGTLPPTTGSGLTSSPTPTGGTSSPTASGGTLSPTASVGTSSPTVSGGTSSPTGSGGTSSPTTSGGTSSPTAAAPPSPPPSFAPVTVAPTTDTPTNQNTLPPTTIQAPTTDAPTTAAPVTQAPTSIQPTASTAPTSSAPTTLAPTTVAPTTKAPVTVAPSTLAPSFGAICPPNNPLCGDFGGTPPPGVTFSFPCCAGPISVPENETTGYLVLTATAIPSSTLFVPIQISYSVALVTTRQRRQEEVFPFAMDPLNGRLTLNGPIDFETRATWPLRVSALLPDNSVLASVDVSVNVAAVPCAAGTFSATGTFPCNATTLCPPGFVESAAATPTSNIVCESPSGSEGDGGGGVNAGAVAGITVGLLLLLLLLLLVLGVAFRRRRDAAKEEGKADEVKTETFRQAPIISATHGTVPSDHFEPAPPEAPPRRGVTPVGKAPSKGPGRVHEYTPNSEGQPSLGQPDNVPKVVPLKGDAPTNMARRISGEKPSYDAAVGRTGGAPDYDVAWDKTACLKPKRKGNAASPTYDAAGFLAHDEKDVMYESASGSPFRSKSYDNALNTAEGPLHDTPNMITPVYDAAGGRPRGAAPDYDVAKSGQPHQVDYDVASGRKGLYGATSGSAFVTQKRPSQPQYDVAQSGAPPAAPQYDVAHERPVATPQYDVGSAGPGPQLADYASAEEFKGQMARNQGKMGTPHYDVGSGQGAPVAYDVAHGGVVRPQPAYDVGNAPTLRAPREPAYDVGNAPAPTLQPEYDIGASGTILKPEAAYAAGETGNQVNPLPPSHPNYDNIDSAGLQDNEFIVGQDNTLRIASVRRANPMYRNSAVISTGPASITEEGDA